MSPESLGRVVQDFLSEASGAVVLEDGAVAFDLAQARYSISGEHNKCLLHLWSAERNTVRRVLEAEVKNGTLRLAVQRLGQARPSKLEICRERDRRSPSAKKAARAAYEPKLRRAIEHNEITVHYQPEFDLASNQIVRFEALARWTHPKLGAIPPLRFIPVAEESGLIVPLGAHALEGLLVVLKRDLADPFLRGVQVLLAVAPRRLTGTPVAPVGFEDAVAAFRVAAGTWLMRVTVRRTVDRRFDPLTAEDAALHAAGRAVVDALREAIPQ